MLARLALLFILLPMLDLYLLIQLGGSIGFWPTLALVLATGAVGAGLARSEGLRVFVAAQKELAAGRLPEGALLDGLAILAGALLLLTPGFLTDVIGLFLLLPPTRGLIKGWARRWLEKQIRAGAIKVATVTPQGWSMRTGQQIGDQPLDPKNEIRQD
jgi:UPF0716 protein FxsA